MSCCREILDFCLDFLEGNLPDGDKARFQKHLVDCPPCGAFFETYRRTPEVTREALAVELPDAVRCSIKDFLRARLTGR